ncbi:hypothetical protein FGO68_gene5122 [Halteria grandinella]|uniref:Uncharacterized protein n=1 Tax=Halteria grandinella TaxID=5974 RepID=A0A8J8TAT6_HALGN|nr:hypothetical protein FGO68_gene5122 [Halteria grandinella]
MEEKKQIVKAIVFKGQEEVKNHFQKHSYDFNALPILQLKVGLEFKDLKIIREAINKLATDKDGQYILNGVQLIDFSLSQFKDDFKTKPKHLISTGYYLHIIQEQKKLCALILKHLNSLIDHSIIENLNQLGKSQQDCSNCDNMVYINQCLENAQKLEDLINQDIKQEQALAYREEIYVLELSQSPLYLELAKQPLHLLFESVYTNKISTSLKLIGDRLLNSYKDDKLKASHSKIFLNKFSFRLVYELIRRDYFNKALEVITSMGWKKILILKGILFNSSDFRMSKIIKNHLMHRGKFTKEELLALEVQTYLATLYPVNSVHTSRQKIHSKCKLQCMNPNFPLGGQTSVELIGIQNLLAQSIEIRDINDYYKVQTSDFTFRRLRSPDFITQIFDFKDVNRSILDVDDCFSRDACKLNGKPICEECSEYIVNFEDMEHLFALPENSYITKYDIQNCKNTGYLVMHTQWLIDYLLIAEEKQVNKNFLFPISITFKTGKFQVLNEQIDSLIQYMNRNLSIKLKDIKIDSIAKKYLCHQINKVISEPLPHFMTLIYKQYLNFQTYNLTINLEQLQLLALNNQLFPSPILECQQDTNIYDQFNPDQFFQLVDLLISVNLQNVAAQLLISYSHFKLQSSQTISNELGFMYYMLKQEIVKAAEYQKYTVGQLTPREIAMIDLAQIFITDGPIQTERISELGEQQGYKTLKRLKDQQYQSFPDLFYRSLKLESSNGEVKFDELIHLIENLYVKQLKENEIKIQLNYVKTSSFTPDLEYYLMQGRVEGAYIQSLLHAHNLEDMVTNFALENLFNEKVTSACVALQKLHSINSSLLKIDLAAAQRIAMDKLNKNFDSYQTKQILALIIGQRVNIEELRVVKYSKEQRRGMRIYQEVVELFLNHHKLRNTIDQETDSRYLQQIVKNLEKATWNLEDQEIQRKSVDGSFLQQADQQQSISPLFDSEDRLSLQQTQAHEKKLDSPWHLVGLFCKVHNLPPSLTLLHELARKNDWIMFLYEAQQQQCPKETTLDIINDYFQSFSIKKHLITVFRKVNIMENPAVIKAEGEGLHLINNQIILEAISNEKKGLLFNLYKVSKQLQKTNNLNELSQYMLTLAVKLKKIEYLLYAVVNSGCSKYQTLIAMLLISFDFKDLQQLGSFNSGAFQDMLIRLLKIDNGQESITKAIKIIEAIDPISSFIVLFKFYAAIQTFQFKNAQNIMQLITSQKNDFVGHSVCLQVAHGSIEQNFYSEQLKMDQKLAMVQICQENINDDSISKKLKILETKARHLINIQSAEVLSFKEIVQKYIDLKKHSEARQLVNELEVLKVIDDADYQIEQLFQLEIKWLLTKLEFLELNDFYQRSQIHAKIASLISVHHVISEFLFERILSDEQSLTFFDCICVIDNLKNHLTFDKEDKSFFYDLQIIRNMLIYNLLDANTSLKDHSLITCIYNPPIHFALNTPCQYKPLPNINLLLQKERCQENQEFLESVVINMLNLNQVHLAMELCSYLQMELAIVRRVRVLCIRVEQVGVLKGAAQAQLIRDIEGNINELASGGQLQQFVDRIRCIVKVSKEYSQVLGSIMSKDASTIETQSNIVTEMIKIAQKDYGICESVKNYIRLSNINAQSLTQQVLVEEIFTDTLLTNQNLKCILNICSRLIEFKMLETYAEPLSMEQKLNVACLLLTYYKKDSNKEELRANQFQGIVEMIGEADIFPEKQLSIITLVLHKLSLNGNESFSQYVLLQIPKYMNYFERVALQSRHILKQLLKILHKASHPLIMQTPLMICFKWRLLNALNSSLPENKAYDLQVYIGELKQAARVEPEEDVYVENLIRRLNNL